MGLFDALLGGGKTTGTSVNTPPKYITDAHKGILGRANSIDANPNRQIGREPFQAYRKIDAREGKASRMGEQRALNGSPLNSAASGGLLNTMGGQDIQQGQVGQARGLLSDTMGGAYTEPGNPYLGGVMDSIKRQVMPAVNSAFTGAGRNGSQVEGEVMAGAMTDALAPYAFQNYGMERGMQNQAMQTGLSDYYQGRGMQEDAFRFAPTMASQDWVDIQGMREAAQPYNELAQRKIDDQMRRFRGPYEQLGLLSNLTLGIGGQAGGTTQTTQNAPPPGLLPTGAGLGLTAYGLGAFG